MKILLIVALLCALLYQHVMHQVEIRESDLRWAKLVMWDARTRLSSAFDMLFQEIDLKYPDDINTICVGGRQLLAQGDLEAVYQHVKDSWKPIHEDAFGVLTDYYFDFLRKQSQLEMYTDTRNTYVFYPIVSFLLQVRETCESRLELWRMKMDD